MPSFDVSNSMLERALRVIPLASQTFSKSITQFPRGVSPLFIERASGCTFWDVDGNAYVDFVNGLLSVSMGHGDPDVTAAIRAQLEKGTSFSLPHPLETEVAEKIVAMVPCAEQVRFCKNGTDATSGAVRIARAHTGRDGVAVCGYHGWQDWYIGSTTRDLGVPQATKSLTHPFTFNDIASLKALLEERGRDIAAVILEPMNVTYPDDGFLEQVQQLTRDAGAVLIFDETITGFRFANGGAQALFGVTPDLATFGKGLANGMPLSVVTGRRDVMQHMEEVFFSSTFGGETLSLAAGNAVLDKLVREPVLERIATRGQEVIDRTQALIDQHGVSHLLRLSGHPSWSFLVFREAEGVELWPLKTLFFQEVFARGIFTLGTHNMSYAHDAAAIDQLAAAYDEVFPILRDAVAAGDVASRLRCEPLRPLFAVRATS